VDGQSRLLVNEEGDETLGGGQSPVAIPSEPLLRERYEVQRAAAGRLDARGFVVIGSSAGFCEGKRNLDTARGFLDRSLERRLPFFQRVAVCDEKS